MNPSTGLSEIAFSTLPQAVQAWIQEIGWKREDITGYHVQHSKPALIMIARGQEKRRARLEMLPSGEWGEKVEEVEQV